MSYEYICIYSNDSNISSCQYMYILGSLYMYVRVSVYMFLYVYWPGLMSHALYVHFKTTYEIQAPGWRQYVAHTAHILTIQGQF